MSKRTRPKGTPSVADVFHDLKQLRAEIRGYGDVDETDVRLQVVDGGWGVHSGDASYDQDHRGCWGAGSVGAKDSDATLRQEARSLVEDMLEDYAMRGGGDFTEDD